MRDLLGVFGGFRYVVCADFYPGASSTPSLLAGHRLRQDKETGSRSRYSGATAGPDARFLVRIKEDAEVLRLLLLELAVLAALALAISTAIIGAAGIVFHRIINRPVSRIVNAMARFEADNVPERVNWKTQ